jgi:hypothetical protein
MKAGLLLTPGTLLDAHGGVSIARPHRQSYRDIVYVRQQVKELAQRPALVKGTE